MERKLFRGKDYRRVRGRGTTRRGEAIPIAVVEIALRPRPLLLPFQKSTFATGR
jgi:hypothetical protein